MSYFTALQLEREPFSTSPDPCFFYRSTRHLTVLRRLEIAVRLRRGLSLVLGDVGTGKTTLSRTLLQSFEGEDSDFSFHIILDPDFRTEEDFLAHLARLFSLGVAQRSPVDLRDLIEKYLYHECVDRSRTVVLLVDEGQKLSAPVIECLRTLLNFETNQQKLLQLVIFSQLELLPKIQYVRNFMDRIAFRALLMPLDEKETGELILFRLAQAGYNGETPVFSPEAVRLIYDYTRGYPRRIARVCHAAMEELSVSSSSSVNELMMAQIIALDRGWH